MKSIKAKIIIIILLLIAIITAIFYNYFDILSRNNIENTNIDFDENFEIVDNNTDNTNYDYLNNRKINEDYVGQIYFESGLLNYPFVQAKGEISDYTFYAFHGNAVKDYENGCEGGYCNLNDVYLRKDWKTGEYDLGGSIFMDYRNKLDDPNIIIYGHLYPKSMDQERKLFFSGLDILLDENNYRNNSKFIIELEHEIRSYEIACVYLFDTTKESDYEDLQYYLTNYDYDYDGNLNREYHQIYLDNIKEKELYDTGIELTIYDKLVTLQTCVDGSDNLVEIIVAKQINE